jgi:dTDP-4-dehydrorhamnose reductase
VRVLILGGDGMLGHRLLRSLSGEHEVRVTLRPEEGAYHGHGLFHAANSFFGVDVRDHDRLVDVFARFRPQAVVNAAGVVKQRPEAKDSLTSIEINALFPHRLARLCAATGARLVHVSTDCVFSGRRGSYRETDRPDPEDLYGRTKLLGELHEAPALTLRSSIIGLEIGRAQGLVEWFLASRGTVKGFRRAIYSGLTTHEMARVIGGLLVRHPDLSDLFHVASAPIDKYTLLSQLARALGRDDVRIEPDDQLVCDRSLSAEAFRAATGYVAPSWEEMLRELAAAIRERKKG